MSTIHYTVPKINCHHCVRTIKTEVGEMEGVKSVQVDLETKNVVVEYDAPASPLKIEELLAEINYPVQK